MASASETVEAGGRNLTFLSFSIIREFSPDKIILFGSYVWGNPSDDSDLDLLVIVPESEL